MKRLRKKDLQDKALEPSKAQIFLSCLEEIEFELKMEVMKGAMCLPVIYILKEMKFQLIVPSFQGVNIH